MFSFNCVQGLAEFYIQGLAESYLQTDLEIECTG